MKGTHHDTLLYTTLGATQQHPLLGKVGGCKKVHS
jgi:hypothetical protein